MITNQHMAAVIATLKRAVRRWPEPIVGHYKNDPYLTLISCLLSLRTKDETTAGASERLFRFAANPKQIVLLAPRTLEKAIFPVGFYKTKAKTVLGISQDLLDRFNGKVPDDLDALLTLKGVGRKTANLVITLAFKKDGICVDTHVHRISNRWGYVKTKSPEETEMALRNKLPRRYWQIYNDLLVSFGQNLCHPTSPWCSCCPLAADCDRAGVVHSR